MRRAGIWAIAICAACLYCAVPANAEVASDTGPNALRALGRSELLQQLRAGGHTIYFRHAATDDSQADDAAATASPACAERGACGDCRQQRNLSDAGRIQARRISEAIRALDFPVGTVVASPLCRAMDTARLLFGRAEPDPAVRGGGPGRPSYPGLVKLISVPVPAGTNRVVVGHGDQFATVAGPANDLDKGEAAIIKGLGSGRFRIVARMRSDDWEHLQSFAVR